MGPHVAAEHVRVCSVVDGCIRSPVRSIAVETPPSPHYGCDCVTYPASSTEVGRATADPRRSWSASRLAARFGTYLMIAGTLVTLIYIIDPAGDCWGTNSVALLKYLPVEIAVIAQGFFWLDARRGRGTSTNLLLLLAFMGIVLVGALISLLRDHASLEDSFLGRGIALLPVFPAYAVLSRTSEGRLFRRWLRLPLVAAGLLITVGLAIWAAGVHFVDQPHIYHEEIFVPVCASMIVYTWKRGTLRPLVMLLLVVSGLLSMKNTGILAAATVAVLLIFCVLRTGGSSATLMLRRVLLAPLSVVILAGAVYVVLYHRDLLPSGSPAVRAFTYSERALRFADHPVAGTFFVGSPLLSLFRSDAPSNLDIPSHSDLLDMLAFGGVIGFALFAIPLWRLTVAGVRRLRESVREQDWLQAYSVAVVSVFITEMAFNPVWNQPALVWIFCLAIACLTRAVDAR